MSKNKVHRLSHLDAAQGASEERPEAYIRYVEDVPQLGNATPRQKCIQAIWLCQVAGRHDG